MYINNYNESNKATTQNECTINNIDHDSENCLTIYLSNGDYLTFGKEEIERLKQAFNSSPESYNM